LSDKHEQKRRPADSHIDFMTHKDNGRESDPHAGHKMSDIQATHDRHAGHSVAMFREKFCHQCPRSERCLHCLSYLTSWAAESSTRKKM
jgi:hypothetical protein